MRYGRKKKVAKTWHNCDIPAKLFFNILSTQNFNLLIKDISENDNVKKPSKGTLNRTWDKIYDEFYLLVDSRQLRLILETKKTVLEYILKIETVKTVLFALAKYQFNEKQLEEIVQQLKEHNIFIDLKGDLTEQVSNIIKYDIAGLETALQIELDNLENLQDGEKRTFEANCVIFEDYGFKVSTDCTLKMYIEYEKAVIAKAAQQKQKRTK